MRPFLACLLIAPLPAMALIPDPTCGIDLATGTIQPFVAPFAVQAVWPQTHRGEVITYDWLAPSDRIDGAVQICPEGQAVRYSISETAHQAMRPRLFEMLESDIVYSLDDIRDMIRGAGGNAWLSVTQGTCGCEHSGW